jgi:AcrR family transcriptional regulator
MTSESKPGRRPGDPAVTKQAILDAARELFGELGFDRATIRAIAARAGVDPALVHHHFGSKQSLFVAAHQLPVDPAEVIAGLVTLPRGELAPHIVRAYLTTFGTPGSPALSLVRAAATNEAAASMLREFITKALLRNASKLVPYPDARLRVVLLASHLIGVVVARAVVGLPEVKDCDVEELVVLLSPMVDRYLNAPDLTS